MATIKRKPIKIKRRPIKKNDAPKAPQIRIRPDVKPLYCNVAVVSYTENEFIFDFVFQAAGDAELVSRIILSPDHVKRFSDVLIDNYNNFEKKFKKNTKK